MTTDVPSTPTFTTAFGRRRRCVFRFVVVFRYFVVRRFLRFTPPPLDVLGAFRFLVRGVLAAAAVFTAGDDDATSSASSCNSNSICSSLKF